VSDAINLVKSIIQGGLSATQGIVSGLLGGIQNSFSSAFNAAKNIVS
jgi:phage-related protein